MNQKSLRIFILCMVSVLIITGCVIGGILLFNRNKGDDVLPPDPTEEIDGSDDEYTKLY